MEEKEGTDICLNINKNYKWMTCQFITIQHNQNATKKKKPWTVWNSNGAGRWQSLEGMSAVEAAFLRGRGPEEMR